VQTFLPNKRLVLESLGTEVSVDGKILHVDVNIEPESSFLIGEHLSTRIRKDTRQSDRIIVPRQ